MTSLPTPGFAHLRRLTDAGGLYEHALGTVPRIEHGYCVDDVARALVVVCRDTSGELTDLRAGYLDFVLAAQAEDGRFRNRRSVDLAWHGEPSVEDCWGRALWGLGAVVAGGAPAERAAALEAFDKGAAWWSPWSRAMSFAALGAAAVHEVLPSHRGARELLAATARSLGRPGPLREWPWPEARLTYANAAVADALIAAGSALQDERALTDGLLLLGWLLEVQTRGSHLSVVPVGGWGPGQRGPVFDQQPIEVSTLADACARALAVTGDERWRTGLQLCTAWFLGSNDSGSSLYDAASGGGYDGLEPDGCNTNQGAESTLALLSTLQQAQRLPVRLA